HRRGLANAALARDEADVAAVFAVVAVVAHDEVLAARELLRLEPTARPSVGREHHLMTAAGKRFDRDDRATLIRVVARADAFPLGRAAVDEQLVVAHRDRVARNRDDA